MQSTRTLTLLTVLALVACGGDDEAAEMDMAADTAAGAIAADPDIAPTGTAAGVPDGYAVRLDRAESDPAEYQVMAMDGGLHVQTGPAGIVYQEADTVPSGDYSVSATFTEVGAPPGHREAYGLFIGGRDLQGDNQHYTYFLVRADGSYLIKRRTGGETSNVSEGGWVESDAVEAAAAEGDLTNRLEVTVSGDQVRFSVNGTEVATVPASEVDARGVAGVRINHNLNVRVEDFSISR